MNYFSVSIDGLAYKNAVFPFKYENLLDEQLNSATLSLTRTQTPYFKPATPVFITIRSVNEANGEVYDQIKTLEYIVSFDRSVESPVGSGFYKHELSLVEPTKLLEIPIESLCFRNAGARNFGDEGFDAVEVEYSNRYGGSSPGEGVQKVVQQLVNVKTPSTIGDEIVFPTIKTLFDALGYTDIADYDRDGYGSCDIKIEIERTDEDKQETLYQFVDENYQAPPIVLKSGITKIIWSNTIRGGGNWELVYSIEVSALPNQKPLVPYSIQSVIDRVLELQEPLLFTHDALERAPRFKFDLNNIPAEKRELFTRYKAPEFTFTRCTLREALQIIGGFIHAEPRLLFNAETQAFDTITFDFFGVDEMATYYDVNAKERRGLKDYPYEDKTLFWSIEQGCNELDAYVENLVNRMGANATTAQPFKNGYQTLRTETAYVRFEDEESEAIFPTDYPVYDIKKFVWFNPDDGMEYDLTPFIYEQAIYNSQLSSYDKTYPTSKAYGLYYKMGEKGIKGFFFKRSALVGAFQKYAIVNIIKKVSGINIISLPGWVGGIGLEKYFSLQFRLEYTPIYSARIKHSKTYVDEWLPQPRTLNYSQSDNMVETQYFGENIKGAVERYGTLEKLITFVCRNLDTIPKEGTKFDEDYYIATVSVETMHDRFKVTCGLSKRFNRLSKYVGLSTYKRIYEVSERMAQTRDTVWDEYVVFADKNKAENASTTLKKPFWVALRATLVGGGQIGVAGVTGITGCKLQGFTKNHTPLNAVVLPVVASAIGNTIEFSCAYKDNFSAGQRKITMDDEAYSTEVEYADYYGRLYYLQWQYGKIDGASTPNDYPLANGVSVKNPLVSVENEKYQVLRKDSAEAIRHNACIHLVADDKKLVIGSGLSRRNAIFVGEDTEEVLFVVLNKPIGVFSDIIDENNIVASFKVKASNVDRTDSSVSFNLSDNPMKNTTSKAINGAAWALITARSSIETTYENEDGEAVSVTETSGGELLIGKNESISASVGEQIGTGFTAFGVHDIYNYLKNKN